jgi:hypothetical protein
MSAFPTGQRVLICGRVDDPAGVTLEPGSIVDTCCVCGAAIRLSLASQRERATRATPSACVQCYAEFVGAGGAAILTRQRPLWETLTRWKR